MTAAATQPKRLTDIRVGDMIQYRYSWGPEGWKSWSHTTRRVIEVIDDGARFVVEGFYNVPAGCVNVHIPMHASSEQSAVGSEQPAQ